MNPSDLLYGARSGIQKAIRRCNLDQAKTCFEILWTDKPQRQWLKWRLTVLVEEDAYQMLGELAEFLEQVKSVKNPKEEEKAWRRFIYRVTVAPKSKDTESMLWVAKQFPDKYNEHPELKKMIDVLPQLSDPTAVGRTIIEGWKADGTWDKFSEYEKRAISVLNKRLYAGGMLADREACIAAMFLIESRGLNQEEVLKEEKRGLERWVKISGGRKPRTVRMEWYAFDMHTLAGKMASSIFTKHKSAKFNGIEKLKFEDVWFYLESARVPDEMLKVVPYDPNAKLTALDNMWWPILVDEGIIFGGYNKEQVKDIWEKEMKKEIANIVVWCLEKREHEK